MFLHIGVIKRHVNKEGAVAVENGKERMKTPNISNDDGYVFVTVIFIIAILTMSAVAIATMSQTESNIVRNERLYMGEFYNADSGISIACEKFKEWETALNVNDYWSSDKDSEKKYLIEDEFGKKTIIEAFRVDEKNSAFNQKNDLPDGLEHIDDPIISSGTGVTGEVLIRRYALAARPENGSVKVQAGVYKYIPGGK